MEHNNVLVVGGSAGVGAELLKVLIASGAKVRITTSKKSPVIIPGVETVTVNLQTGEGLKNAFEGIERAFFMSPGGYADQYSILAPLIQEAKRRGLKKVVLMSAMGANAVETSPLRRAEVELEKSGLAYNIIRPNWFLQNFHTFWIQGILSQNKILLPAGQAKVSFIDARDIGAVAAKLLVNDDLNNQAFDLTGAEAVDHNEVAKAISQVTGKKITYQEIEPAVLKQGLLGAGLPEDYSSFLLIILGALRDGYSAPVTDNVKKILGRAPISLKQYTEDFKKSWAA